MFERFTNAARTAIVLSQEEARMLNHNYIGTEHLLHGLAAMPESAAARALSAVDVVPEEVRRRTIEIIGEGSKPPGGHLPFTPRAKKVLELSLREAVRLGHDFLGTGHMLLGLLAEGEGVAAQILAQMEVRSAVIREIVIDAIDSTAEDATSSSGPTEPPTEEELAEHAGDLAKLYLLSPDEVAQARRLLGFHPDEAKPGLALFVRFAKVFGVDPLDLARFLLSNPSDSDRRDGSEGF